MAKLEEKKKNDKIMSALLFSKIHGIGPIASKQLADDGSYLHLYIYTYLRYNNDK